MIDALLRIQVGYIYSQITISLFKFKFFISLIDKLYKKLKLKPIGLKTEKKKREKKEEDYI